MSGLALVMEEVTKDFNPGWGNGLRVRALDRVNLAIPRGVIFGLWGGEWFREEHAAQDRVGFGEAGSGQLSGGRLRSRRGGGAADGGIYARARRGTAASHGEGRFGMAGAIERNAEARAEELLD